MSIFYSIISVLAGLGISLYGFIVLREGLETSLGAGFKRVIGKVSDKHFAGYCVTAGVTGLWQSTTLTLSMASSFLNIGTIGLTQGVVLMLGVELGSALSIVLLAFQSIDLMKILSILCVIGAFLMMFARTHKMRQVSLTIMGLGLLFAGVAWLSDGMGAIVDNQGVYDVIAQMANPVVLFLVGAVLSVVTNSMYATVAIITAMVGATGGGPLDIMGGVYMLFGATAVGGIVPLLYCINNSSRESKAMLLGYNLFKLFATFVFILLSFVPWMVPLYDLMAHQTSTFLVFMYLIMMLVPGLLLLPFCQPLGRMLLRFIPKNKKSGSVYDSFVPDENSLKIFSVALPWLVNNIFRIIEMETKLMTKVIGRLGEKLYNDKGIQSEIKGLEKIIRLTNNTAIRISAKLNDDDLAKLNVLINITSDANHYLERIIKVNAYGQKYKTKPHKLSKEQYANLSDLWQNIEKLSAQLCELAKEMLNNNLVLNNESLGKVLALCQENENLNTTLRKNVFSKGQCKISGEYGLYFDILLAYENINIDLSNIAIKIGVLSN